MPESVSAIANAAVWLARMKKPRPKPCRRHASRELAELGQAQTIEGKVKAALTMGHSASVAPDGASCIRCTEEVRPAKFCYVPGMKPFVIDTIATVAFFTLIAAFSELVVVGMEPRQVLIARAIMIPVMVLTGRPYGLWRDWITGQVRSTRRVARIAFDTLAFLTFQVPVYVVTLLMVGANADDIAMATASAMALMLVVGRPFGLFLDVIRRWSGTAPA